MMSKPKAPKGVNALAREIGTSAQTVSRKRQQGKTDEQIRQEAIDHQTKELEKKSVDRVSYTEAQRRKEMALAELRELDLAKARGEVASTVEVNQYVATMILRAREILLRMAAELGDRVAQTSDPIECRRLIETEVHRALRQLAEFTAAN
jgi:hypothetical protein